ncbi:MAG: HAMP domain-containing histidine kinase [Coriobacteriia bacterium]|nr:HAMP domain-containing histidine kinase [Coriobacteriia bacterium]
MMKLLSSRAARIILLLIGYIATVMVVQDVSVTLRGYLASIFGFGFYDWFPLSVILLLACVALFLISVWNAPVGKGSRGWQVDLLTVVALAVCVILSCLFFGVYHLLGNYLSPLLLLYSIFAYLVIMATLAILLIRIRDKQLKTQGTWLRFFRAYPPGHPLGLIMLLVFCGNLLLLLFIGPPLSGYGFLNPAILLMLFSSVMLLALDYFCSYVLSLVAEYEKANEDKVQAERFKTELITNVSHDIRTPLTSIISYVDLLKTLPVEQEEFSEYVGVLDRKSARLKTLIDDLMEASKAGTGNLPVDKEEIDLVEIVGQVAGEFEEQFAECELTLVLPQPDAAVLVWADSRHLWRALENLFSNAAKYALPGTRVFVEMTRGNGSSVVLIVRNISKEPIEVPVGALTEQFIRGDRARQTEGSGLGLYIAKSLMELMDGELRIQAIGDLFEVQLLFA